MILHLIQCEACAKQIRFDPSLYRRYSLKSPDSTDNWLTLHEGDPDVSEGWHFCSRECLNAWCAKQENGEHAPLLPAGDWDVLSRQEKGHVRDFEFSLVRAFEKSRDRFALQYPELYIDWRFQLEPRIRKEKGA